jgi:tryptophan-rich sensory protein
LILPALQPPGWAFGAAWTTLYALMAVAAWRAWRASDAQKPALPAMALYGGQLVLNALWPFVFFGLKQPWPAIGVIAVLFIAVLWTARVFFLRDRIAGLLLVPYVLWLAFAGYLNIAIAVTN